MEICYTTICCSRDRSFVVESLALINIFRSISHLESEYKEAFQLLRKARSQHSKSSSKKLFCATVFLTKRRGPMYALTMINQ